MENADNNYTDKNINELEQILHDLLDGKENIAWYPIKEEVKQAIFDKILTVREEIRARHRKQRKFYILGFIFSLALLALAAYNIYYLTETKRTVSSPSGQISRIRVGSATIHLNANTNIDLDKNGGEKNRITLKDGEIYIDNPGDMYFEIVVKDKVIVFFNGNVDIVSRDNYTKVSSFDADVIINQKGSEKIMRPNQQMQYFGGKDTLSYIKQAGTVGVFRNGFLYYDNDPLSYVLQDIANAFQLEITFTAKDKFPSAIAIDALLSIHDDPLKLIQSILPPPYSATQQGNKIIIEAGSIRDK